MGKKKQTWTDILEKLGGRKRIEIRVIGKFAFCTCRETHAYASSDRGLSDDEKLKYALLELEQKLNTQKNKEISRQGQK